MKVKAKKAILAILLFLIVIVFVTLVNSINFNRERVKFNSERCECSSCNECEILLNDSTCQIVKLKSDIVNYTKKCINNVPSNKVFDCQTHKIDGIRELVIEWGIYTKNKENITIKNCYVSDFNQAIYIREVNYSFVQNNKLINNINQGVYLLYSSHNKIENNYAENNWIGYLSSGETDRYNKFYNNIATKNKIGFYFYGHYNEISYNKACDNIVNNVRGDVVCNSAPDNYGYNNSFRAVVYCPNINYTKC